MSNTPRNLSTLSEEERTVVKKAICHALHGQPDLLSVLEQNPNWTLETERLHMSPREEYTRTVHTSEGVFHITKKIYEILTEK